MKWAKTKQGFTIVELIIVIGVIAILAAIVIVSYGAWRQDLSAKQVKSDLQSSYSAMKDAQTWGEDGYPSSLPATIVASEGVNLTMSPRSGGRMFCIEGGSSSYSSMHYYVSDKTSEPKEGTCDIEITQLAGNISTGGTVDGNGASARFNRTEAIAVADDGTMFAADGALVRKVTPNGDVTTYAGGATSGPATGPAATAYLRGPRGVAVDKNGSDVYVGPINNNAVYIITAADMMIADFATNVHVTDFVISPYTGKLYVLEGDNYAGKVYSYPPTGGSVKTLLAGNATNATVDGVGSAASLYDPRGIAVSPVNDELYICENNGGHVRKVTQAGVATTYAGSGGAFTGGASTALYAGCGSVEVDKNGNVYVTASNRLQMIRPSGEVLTLATLPTSMTDLSFGNDGELYASSLRSVFKIKIP